MFIGFLFFKQCPETRAVIMPYPLNKKKKLKIIGEKTFFMFCFSKQGSVKITNKTEMQHRN